MFLWKLFPSQTPSLILCSIAILLPPLATQGRLSIRVRSVMVRTIRVFLYGQTFLPALSHHCSAMRIFEVFFFLHDPKFGLECNPFLLAHYHFRSRRFRGLTEQRRSFFGFARLPSFLLCSHRSLFFKATAPWFPFSENGWPASFPLKSPPLAAWFFFNLEVFPTPSSLRTYLPSPSPRNPVLLRLLNSLDSRPPTFSQPAHSLSHLPCFAFREHF